MITAIESQIFWMFLMKISFNSCGEWSRKFSETENSNNNNISCSLLVKKNQNYKIIYCFYGSVKKRTIQRMLLFLKSTLTS